MTRPLLSQALLQMTDTDPNMFEHRYKGELDMKRKVIQMQRKIKEELAEHEKRVTELTIKLRQQYDPTLDSPRRVKRVWRAIGIICEP